MSRFQSVLIHPSKSKTEFTALAIGKPRTKKDLKKFCCGRAKQKKLSSFGDHQPRIIITELELSNLLEDT